jgi:hypothetical protein
MAPTCPCTLCTKDLHSLTSCFELQSQCRTVQNRIMNAKHIQKHKLMFKCNTINNTCNTICGYRVCPLRIGGSRVTTTKVCGWLNCKKSIKLTLDSISNHLIAFGYCLKIKETDKRDKNVFGWKDRDKNIK